MLIAMATDKNYVELAGVLIRSIAANGDVPEAQIVVCGENLDASDHTALRKCAGGMSVEFVDLDETASARLEHAHRTANWPLTSWGKVLLPDLIRSKAGRLLYLDCDIVVAKSLRPLFDIEMGSNMLACVPVDKGPDFVDALNVRLSRAPGTPYFNSGVMLIDLSKWNAASGTERVLDAARRFGNSLSYPDQDALNIFANGEFLQLDRGWNFYSVTQDFSAASIIHFVYEKPHIAGSKHPARHLYLGHRSETPWSRVPLISPWVKKRKKWLRKLSTMVGLR
jgi:lipopolysaccharide biosynthesis glycosyltransferase